MTIDPRHRFQITVAHPVRGVPERAECSCGSWSWTRPAGDRWADTLPPAARAHQVAAAVLAQTGDHAGHTAEPTARHP